MRTTRMRLRRGALAAGTGAALLLTAACGQAENMDDQGGGGGDDTGAGGEVTIRFAWWGNPDRARMTQEAIDAFNEEHPDITVETEFTDFDAYWDRLATSVAAGDEPDVITMGGAYPREYGSRGTLLDLAEVSDIIDTSVYDEAALANGHFDGTQYGVPTGVNSYGVVANPRVFEEAGVPMPDDDSWSWEDYAEIAAEISANSPDDVYGSEDPTAPDTLDLFADQHTGSGLYTEDGGLAVTPDTVEQWFDLTTGLVESGATPEATVSVELMGQPNPEQTLMGQGLAGMTFAWTNQLQAFAEASGDDLVMLRAPGETTEQEPGQWLQASQLYTIGANSDHPEAAAELISFLTTSTAAADAIGSDRGVPAVAELREHLEPDLQPVQQTEYAYIDRMTGLIDGDFVIGPPGSADSPSIMDRVNEQVLFEQLSPAEGGQQFIDEMNAAIESS
ncbi:ABC transporter substrate-binding protein [Georgenia alba]|uniref:ABC transporter substrate-binding protein n=1 Tax=Georgenia alba TaxID=2233858 RepID=A0ABW2QA18_9MICO